MRLILCVLILLAGCAKADPPDMTGAAACCMSMALIEPTPRSEPDLGSLGGRLVTPAVYVVPESCPCVECKCDPCDCPSRLGEAQEGPQRVEPVASRRVRVCGPDGCRWVEVPDEPAESKPAASASKASSGCASGSCGSWSRPTPVRTFLRRLFRR